MVMNNCRYYTPETLLKGVLQHFDRSELHLLLIGVFVSPTGRLFCRIARMRNPESYYDFYCIHDARAAEYRHWNTLYGQSRIKHCNIIPTGIMDVIQGIPPENTKWKRYLHMVCLYCFTGKKL